MSLVDMLIVNNSDYKPGLSPTSVRTVTGITDEDEREILTISNILLKLAKHKKKRQRTSPDQLAVLEKIFKYNHTPDQETRQKLSRELGMTSRRIQIWFQNKRAKLKKIQQSENPSDELSDEELEEEDSDELTLYSPESPNEPQVEKLFPLIPSLSHVNFAPSAQLSV